MIRLGRYAAAAVTLFAIAMLIAAHPLGVLAHVVHDHHAEHSYAAQDDVAMHVEDADPADHDADHAHVWMTLAAALITPQVCQPQAIAALGILEDAPRPSAAPLPPFAPPRA